MTTRARRRRAARATAGRTSRASCALPCDEGQRARAPARPSRCAAAARARGAGRRAALARERRAGPRPACAHVVTLHDVTFFRITHLRRRHDARRCSTVVARRGAPRRRADRRLGRGARRDRATMLGLDPARFTRRPPRRRAAARHARRAGGRGPRDALRRSTAAASCCASARSARTRTRRLLVARCRSSPDDVALVLAGHPEPDDGRAARARRASSASTDRVRFAGYVADAELEALWRLAGVRRLPDRAEGFGLPVLEAMPRGVPVACSDIPVLREVGGGVRASLRPRRPGRPRPRRSPRRWRRRRGASAAARGPRGSPGRRRRAGTYEAYERALRVIHVGLNLVFLVPGRDRRHGGRRPRADPARCATRAPALRFTAFVNREAAGEDLGVESVVVPVDAAQPRRVGARRAAAAAAAWPRRAGCDLVHSLGSTAPARGALRARDDDPRPQLHARARTPTSACAALGMRVLVPLAARRSHRVIADSAVDARRPRRAPARAGRARSTSCRSGVGAPRRRRADARGRAARAARRSASGPSCCSLSRQAPAQEPRAACSTRSR